MEVDALDSIRKLDAPDSIRKVDARGQDSRYGEEDGWRR